MVETSTRTGGPGRRPATGAYRPWPTRREREGGVARPAHPGAVPRMRTPEQERADAVTDALLASVPPFGTPPFGTRGTAAAPSGRAATRSSRTGPAAGAHPVAPRNGPGVASLCLALVGLPFALSPLTGVIAASAGALAVVSGLLGWSRARRGTATNRTMSVVATALGVLVLVAGAAGTVLLFRATGALLGDLEALVAPTGGSAAPGPSGSAPGATVPWSG